MEAQYLPSPDLNRCLALALSGAVSERVALQTSLDALLNGCFVDCAQLRPSVVSALGEVINPRVLSQRQRESVANRLRELGDVESASWFLNC